MHRIFGATIGMYIAIWRIGAVALCRARASFRASGVTRDRMVVGTSIAIDCIATTPVCYIACFGITLCRWPIGYVIVIVVVTMAVGCAWKIALARGRARCRDVGPGGWTMILALWCRHSALWDRTFGTRLGRMDGYPIVGRIGTLASRRRWVARVTSILAARIRCGMGYTANRWGRIAIVV